jgi:hypothetical protein
MAVGFPTKVTYANGDVFSASDINDTNGTINLLGSSVAYAAGKNKIYNSDFSVWQRGTSFTPTTGSFTADRWKNFFDGTGSTRTYSQQTFTPGAAPVAGYEGTYFLRLNQSVAGTTATFNELDYQVEDVRTLAGQTATISFWAKAAATTVLPSLVVRQVFGSGGSPSALVNTTVTSNISLTTSWVRYSFSLAIPSISGKTIGTTAFSSYLQLIWGLPLNATFTVDIWGVQLEQGSTATAFQTASGAGYGGELALCQRYFEVINGAAIAGIATSATTIGVTGAYKVVKRVDPTLTGLQTALAIYNGGGGYKTSTASVYSFNSVVAQGIYGFGSSITGFTTLTNPGITIVNTTTDIISASAEY